jgi:site-specific recombinase XerD
MNLSSAIEGYLLFKAARAAKTTIQTDCALLRQFQLWLKGDPDVATIDPDTVRRYLEHQEQRGLSPHTRRRIHATLSRLYPTNILWPEGSNEQQKAIHRPAISPRRMVALTFSRS